MARLFLAGALIAALLSLTPSSALANGGTVQLSNAQAGPYQVSVFTNPNPIRVGTVDVSVLVQRQGSTDVEQDAVVMVTAEPLAGQGKGETFEATHEQATNKLYYAANVSLPSEGRWRINALIVGPAGDGEVSFEVEATREGIADNPMVLVGLIAAPIVLVLGWIVLRSRGSRDATAGGGSAK